MRSSETGQDNSSASGDDESASKRRRTWDLEGAELRKPHGCGREMNQEAKKILGVSVFCYFVPPWVTLVL